MPPTPSNGRIATESTMMPIPPIQWVNERQNSTPRGSDSMSPNTVAPVVVKPDTDSNTASMGEPITPVQR